MGNWLLFAEIYLGIGLVVCLIVVIAHQLGKRGESVFVRDALRAFDPRRKSFFYRALVDFIIPSLAFFLIWLIWPVAIRLKIKEIFTKKSASSSLRKRPEVKVFTLNKDELLREVSIEEVERTNFIQDPLEAVLNVPFGHCNARWVALRDSLQPNETLWEFESNRSELLGAELMYGYAVKVDERVDRFMTSGWKLSLDALGIKYE